MNRWPEQLLTQNSELRASGIYNWTLPAHYAERSNGERFHTCPNAGVCARVCYAKFGTYQFSNVKERHLENLNYVLTDGYRWERQMLAETKHRRLYPSGRRHRLAHDPSDTFIVKWLNAGGKAIRIHDAGDFFDEEYLERWLRIARRRPHLLFYAYTKQVELLKRYLPDAPVNFRVVFSIGGLQDHLIDKDKDRHADVFPTLSHLLKAGYFNQEDNDLLAVTAPTTRIGIVQNNLPVAIKRFDGKAMSQLRPTNNQRTTTETGYDDADE